jgi:ankyrin repeat protein
MAFRKMPDPLREAFRTGNLSQVQAFVSGDDWITCADSNGYTWLLTAACYNYPCVVDWLVDQGANLEERELSFGRTPLHVACFYGNLSVAQCLVARGASVTSACLYRNHTPLHIASNWGWVDLARWLLTQGASVDACDRDGLTPLHNACFSSHLDLVRVLVIEGNADPNPPGLIACRTFSKDEESKNLNRWLDTLGPTECGLK